MGTAGAAEGRADCVPMMRHIAQVALFFLFFPFSCGFHTPYRPDDSRHFQILSSKTFAAYPRKRFDLSYADGTVLKGFNGIDVVKVSFSWRMAA